MKKITKAQYGALIKSSKKENIICSYQVNEKEVIDISITPQISTVDRIRLVDQIVNCLFSDEDYLFYLKSTIYWYYMVSSFTNLPIPPMFTSSGEDNAVFNHQVLADVYSLAVDTDLGADILSALGSNAALINDEIEAGIEFRKSQILQKGSSFEKMMEAAGGFLDMLEGVAKKFTNIDPKVISDVAKKLGGMDEKKIVDLITAKDK